MTIIGRAMPSAITFLRKLKDCHCKGHVSIFLFLRDKVGKSSYIFFFLWIQAHTIDVTLMTSQLGLMWCLGLTWHHGGVTRGTWHVLTAYWCALDVCWHIQAHLEHMKARERKVIIPSVCDNSGLEDSNWAW